MTRILQMAARLRAAAPVGLEEDALTELATKEFPNDTPADIAGAVEQLVSEQRVSLSRATKILEMATVLSRMPDYLVTPDQQRNWISSQFKEEKFFEVVAATLVIVEAARIADQMIENEATNLRIGMTVFIEFPSSPAKYRWRDGTVVGLDVFTIDVSFRDGKVKSIDRSRVRAQATEGVANAG